MMRNLPNISQNLPDVQCFALESLPSFWKALAIFSCQTGKFLEISFGR